VADVGLVSCVKSKADTPARAADLYTSSWFRKAKKYIESHAERWYVLSAKYGVLTPNEVVAPHEKALTTMPAGDRQQWAKDVLTDLDELVTSGEKVILLAGKRYREFLIGPLRRRDVQVIIPMKGLGLGEQLRWLNTQNGGRE